MGDLPAHGLVRYLPWSVKQLSSSSVTFTIASTPETKEAYPHDWLMESTVMVSDTVNGGLLKQTVCRFSSSYTARTDGILLYESE